MAQNSLPSAPAPCSGRGMRAALLLAGLFAVATLLSTAAQNARAASAPTPAACIADLERNVLHTPGDASQWTALGNMYFDVGMPNRAITAYTRALQLRPDDANVLTDLGIMFRETARYREAVEAFEKAVRLNPMHQNAMFNLGVVLYFDLGQHEEGRLVWNRLLRLNPQARTPDGQSLAALLNTLE